MQEGRPINEENEFTERPDLETAKISSQNIMSLLSINSDAVFRKINICGNSDIEIMLVYIDGLASGQSIADDIIKPLMSKKILCEAKNEKEAIALIERGFVYSPNQKIRNNLKETVNDILTGSCALIFDEERIAITFEVKGFQQRSISEPTEENIIKGPKDVFVENIRVNTATIRRRLKSPELVIEQTIVGKRTLTPVAIVYMEGIVNKRFVSEIKKRLDSIDIDGPIESGYIEEFIVSNKHTIFPLVISTERPDKFSRNMLQGRVGIIIDGIPLAFIIPGSILNFLNTSEDYSQNYIVVTLIRILRYSCIMITLFLPAFYVAVVTFHQEMIPSELALSIASSKEGVPYPSFVEVIFLLISFEILLESSLRLPKNIGQAVSIVGALVVGEAAVSAKFLSPAIVVIIAITAITGFAVPSQDLSYALRLYRFILVFLSSLLGLIGMTFGVIFLLYHLASMETFGVPYMIPFVASEGRDLEDSILRVPLPNLKYRPFMLKTRDKKHQR